jgi:hypothetical protein
VGAIWRPAYDVSPLRCEGIWRAPGDVQLDLFAILRLKGEPRECCTVPSAYELVPSARSGSDPPSTGDALNASATLAMLRAHESLSTAYSTGERSYGRDQFC